MTLAARLASIRRHGSIREVVTKAVSLALNSSNSAGARNDVPYVPRKRSHRLRAQLAPSLYVQLPLSWSVIPVSRWTALTFVTRAAPERLRSRKKVLSFKSGIEI